MYCGKCGTYNADTASFCVGCGTKLTEDNPQQPLSPVASTEASKNRKVGIIAVAACAAVILAIILALCCGGRSYKQAATKFIKSTFDGDVKGMMNLVPKKMYDDLLEEEGYDEDEWDEFLEDGKESMESTLQYLEYAYGEHIKVSCKVVDVENFDRDDLEELKEQYEEYDVKVTAAKEVELEYTIKGDDGKTTDTLTVPVIKVGSKWYVDVLSAYILF